MLFKPKLSFQRKRPAALIYAVVFSSRFSVLLVLFLFTSFLVQPIHQAYANEAAAAEVEVVEEQPVAKDVAPQIVDTEAEQVTDEIEVTEDIESETVETISDNEEASDVDENIAPVTDEAPPATDEEIVIAATTTSDTTDEGVLSTATTSPDMVADVKAAEDDSSTSTQSSIHKDTNTTVTSSATTTDSATVKDSVTDSEEAASSTESTSGGGTDTNDDEEVVVPSDSEVEEVAETNQTSEELSENDVNDNAVSDIIEDDAEVSPESDETDLASTTEMVETEPDNTVEAQNLVTEDNYYQFSRQSCVAIGDGTFHCSVKTESGFDTNAVVYSELGENSNMEIFLRTSKGEVKQLTDNEFDDTSPHYDAESLQIVWQRLIDGRYQIILYDIKEEKENQLTFSRTNNMEPKVSNEGIVWQSWDGNDWEIMMFDGKYTDQLTDNLTQDIAPAINEGYVLWSVLGGDEQEARVYSLASGEVLNINGYEGGVIANPRFVLVYDTKYDNGDVVTQGFDPTTGLSAPIAAHPAENPVDIPDTDSTGETRALIQNKSSQKDELSLNTDKDVMGSTTPSTSDGLASTTKVTSETLDLTKPLESVASSTEEAPVNGQGTESGDILELTDYDLILLPGATSTNTDVATNTEPGT